MEIKEFQLKSTRTLNQALPKDMNIVNMCLGTYGEFSEVSELIKKHVFQGHELNREKVKEELGDTMFYLVNLATELDIDMTEVLQNNVDKLLVRYPEGFTAKASVERVDVNART